MLNHNYPVDLEIVDAKIQLLDKLESKYNRRNNQTVNILFGAILLVEVFCTTTVIYKHGSGNNFDKMLKAIGGSALPVVVTCIACYYVATQYGVKQEKAQLHEQYRSHLDI